MSEKDRGDNVVPLKEARRTRRSNGGSGGKKQSIAEFEAKIRGINAEFALVLVGGAASVLHETFDFKKRPIVIYMKVDSLKIWLAPHRVFDAETERFVGLGDVWLKHPTRRSYRGVIFAPEGAPPGFYNLWKGFTVDAAPVEAPSPKGRLFTETEEQLFGEVVGSREVLSHARHFPTLFDHVFRNVAGGSADLARWLWGWFAHLIQCPTERIGTAVALRGKQGVGKSKLGEAVGSLIGTHWVKLSKPKHIVGQFNGHMVAALLIQAEEGFWAGDKEAEGALKDLITSDEHQIEKKGIDIISVRNLTRLLITSNHDWVVPAGFEERRTAVIDVLDGNLQDHAFFGQIDEELGHGGREHLLAFLQKFDLTTVNVRKIPLTEGLFEQKVASMNEFQSWWLDRLRSERLLHQHSKWHSEVAVDPLYRSYIAYADRMSKGRRMSKEQFGMALRKIVPEKGFRLGQKMWVQIYDEEGREQRNSQGEALRQRVNAYHIPELPACRRFFCDLIHHEIQWGMSEEEERAVEAARSDAPPASAPAQGAQQGGENWKSPVSDDFELRDE